MPEKESAENKGQYEIDEHLWMDQPICGHGLLLSRSVGLVTAHHAAYTALKPQLADCRIEGLMQYLARYDEVVFSDWINASCCKMGSRVHCMPRTTACTRALDSAFTSPLIFRQRDCGSAVLSMPTRLLIPTCRQSNKHVPLKSRPASCRWAPLADPDPPSR